MKEDFIDNGLTNPLKNKKILVIQKMGSIGGAEKNLEKIIDSFSEKYHVSFLILSPCIGPFFARLSSKSVSFIRSNLPDWRKGKNFISRYFYILKHFFLLREKTFDLIYVNDFFYAPYGLSLSRLKKVPCIVHVQSDIEEKRVSQYKLDKVDGVIVTTFSTFERVNKFFSRSTGSTGKKLFLVQYGSDVRDNNHLSIENKKGNFIFGIVANVLPHKGIKFFLSLIKSIKDMDLKDWEIHWVGGDPQSIVNDLRKEVFSLNLQSKVFFDGFVNNMDDFYESIDCLIHPAQYEPFGIAMIEAMSHGIPVISTKTSGGMEILGDVDDGRWLVDLDDFTGMLRRMSVLMKNQAVYQKVSLLVFDKFMENYTIEISMKKMENIFIEALENRITG